MILCRTLCYVQRRCRSGDKWRNNYYCFFCTRSQTSRRWEKAKYRPLVWETSRVCPTVQLPSSYPRRRKFDYLPVGQSTGCLRPIRGGRLYACRAGSTQSRRCELSMACWSYRLLSHSIHLARRSKHDRSFGSKGYGLWIILCVLSQVYAASMPHRVDDRIRAIVSFQFWYPRWIYRRFLVLFRLWTNPVLVDNQSPIVGVPDGHNLWQEKLIHQRRRHHCQWGNHRICTHRHAFSFQGRTGR